MGSAEVNSEAKALMDSVTKTGVAEVMAEQLHAMKPEERRALADQIAGRATMVQERDTMSISTESWSRVMRQIPPETGLTRKR